MFAVLVLIIVALGALLRRALRQTPAEAVIVSPAKSTVIAQDGAVRSVQSAQLTMDRTELERLWKRSNLENLARTYWQFLSRVTLGLIRVVYSADSRSVVFIVKPLTLLRFEAPEYTVQRDRGAVRWRIRDGLLVAPGGHGSGYLALDVKREPDDPDGRARVSIDVDVSNFYPSIAEGFSTPVYQMTQSAVHVLVTHAFLRSLAKLDLATSKVRQLAD